ncbi:hypothetical protein B296_00002006 [Ensete ventricosum]|uniref:PARP catalytic domain-containing protein n=1 Tax=Ensete ventricosum TaxID=4639 RepID=A0A427BA39_ENSVE|nr:hypothetical protein B296_00002006 [Ensete ventricosum]
MLASDRLPPKHTIRLIQNDNDTQADALLLRKRSVEIRRRGGGIWGPTECSRSERRAKNSSLCSTGSTQKSLHLCRTHCPLVELHRVLQHSTPTRRSCWEAFHDQLKATQQKRGEHQNDKAAFYEAPKEKVIRTITDGFDVSGAPEDGGHFGLGLYLTPEPFAIQQVGCNESLNQYVSTRIRLRDFDSVNFAVA